jgi:hypothetical protein
MAGSTDGLLGKLDDQLNEVSGRNNGLLVQHRTQISVLGDVLLYTICSLLWGSEWVPVVYTLDLPLL